MLLCLDILSHAIDQKLSAFSSGPFIVYFAIQSVKWGYAGMGKTCMHMFHLPSLGECFKTVCLYVWNVHLRNRFKIHNLREWKLFPMHFQCAMHMYLICNRQMSKCVSSFHILLNYPLIKECCINLCEPAVKSTFKLLAPGEKCPSHSKHKFIMSYL